MHELDLFAAPAAVADPDQREALLSRECAGRRRVRFLECAVLIAVGLVVFELAWHYPSSRHASSWREGGWLIWYHAHQLFGRDPEELAEPELEHVRQWCRCLALLDRYNKTGLNGLTDDECDLVVETLEKRYPNLQAHVGLLPIYEACRRRLADARMPHSGDGM